LAVLIACTLAGGRLQADPLPVVAPANVASEPPKTSAPTIDSGDTAWMLVSTGLVMFMVPGLALFYGGIVRRKNLLGTMMHSMVALGIVGVQWVLFGYSLSFGNSQGGLIGWNSHLVGLNGVLSNSSFANTSIPIYVHCMYQGMFAIITPALISGAIAERIKFGPYCLFVFLWSALVYSPLAHWVWAIDKDGNPVGWLGKMGALDFAGGTVVHVAAGVSGLAAILFLRKRIGYPQHAMHPNSMVLTLFGAGILWFGWFGFNGGSGLGIGKGIAGAALTATQVAAATAGLCWMLIEWIHRGKPTALGFATGLVAGLVAVTPASGFVRPLGAMAIGVAVAAVCYAILVLKPKLKYDDSLDAFGVHGVGGFLGAVLTGVFVSAQLYEAGTGSPLSPDYFPIATGDRIGQILVQFTAAAVAVAFSFGITFVLIKAIDLTWGFCLEPKDESEGLDFAVHGETAFDFGLAAETVMTSDAGQDEPKAATTPPAVGNRFTVVVDGSNNGELMHVWSDLCKADAAPPSPEFQSVYPYVTTVQGNRFRFRGGEPERVAGNLAGLFKERLPGRKIQARVEKN
jgi:ammonium transporter, Amt family